MKLLSYFNLHMEFTLFSRKFSLLRILRQLTDKFLQQLVWKLTATWTGLPVTSLPRPPWHPHHESNAIKDPSWIRLLPVLTGCRRPFPSITHVVSVCRRFYYSDFWFAVIHFTLPFLKRLRTILWWSYVFPKPPTWQMSPALSSC